ncbi:MAG TPA: membrane protein insertase YidC [Gammaproteobacteria bacterium]|nr:membrane protein insertase YidC [Gammaproteobacteria bacterium]
MDNQRLILFVALAIVTLLLWDAWRGDTTAPPPSQVSGLPVDSGPPAPDAGATVPAADAGSVPAVPPSPVPEVTRKSLKKGKRIRVVTDRLVAEIDTLGGDVRIVDLPDYPVSPDQPDKPVRLLNDAPSKLHVAQSGLISASGAPDHHTLYDVPQTHYELAPGQDRLTVPLRWTDGKGLTVTKTYTFTRDRYVIDLKHTVHNATTSPWEGRSYRQLQRIKTERASKLLYTYTGGVISTDDDNYRKISFDDMAQTNLDKDTKGGWLAMIQHYFVAAWLLNQGESDHLYSKALSGDRFVLGAISSPLTVASGSEGEFSSRLFVGPKLQHRLEAAAPNLDLTVDYGWLTFISKPLFLLMEGIHYLVGNWGVSIIVLTFLVKLLFYIPSRASYRSMAKMRKLQPKFVQLKERYGEDRQRLGQAMMELYKKEKVNPLGGCLPILIQIPVFIALYWVLLESIELRQAPFALWIQDLSVKDPYYVLPLLMGATMFIQQKLNPPPPDPLQAKILMALPFIFTLFFAFFPAGLVLYWVSNNTLSIAQQWYVMRELDAVNVKTG